MVKAPRVDRLPESFGFGDHCVFGDGEHEGIAEFKARVTGGVGRQRANEEGFALDNNGGARLAVAVEQVVAVTAEVEGGIAQGDDGNAGFGANAVLIGRERQLNGAVAAGEQVVAREIPGSLKALIDRRSGQKRMGAADASPARGEDQNLVGAFGAGGVRIEAANEALRFDDRRS